MKTLIFLLIPFMRFSQLRIYTEVDPRNALFGSDVNEAAYDSRRESSQSRRQI